MTDDDRIPQTLPEAVEELAAAVDLSLGEAVCHRLLVQTLREAGVGPAVAATLARRAIEIARRRALDPDQ